MRKSLILITCAVALSGCSEKIPEETKAVSNILAELGTGFQIGLNKTDFAKKLIQLGVSIKNLEGASCKEKCQLALQAAKHSFAMSVRFRTYWGSKVDCITHRGEMYSDIPYRLRDQWCDRLTYIPIKSWRALSEEGRDKLIDLITDNDREGFHSLYDFIDLHHAYKSAFDFYSELNINGDNIGFIASVILDPKAQYSDAETNEFEVLDKTISVKRLSHEISLGGEINKLTYSYKVFDKIISKE